MEQTIELDELSGWVDPLLSVTKIMARQVSINSPASSAISQVSHPVTPKNAWGKLQFILDDLAKRGSSRYPIYCNKIITVTAAFELEENRSRVVTYYYVPDPSTETTIFNHMPFALSNANIIRLCFQPTLTTKNGNRITALCVVVCKKGLQKGWVTFKGRPAIEYNMPFPNIMECVTPTLGGKGVNISLT